MITQAALAFFLHQHPDPVKGAEMLELSLKGQAQQHEGQRQDRVRRDHKDFEKKFNALVAAIENFGRRYNEARGQVWPKREADALRKAMEDVRKVTAFNKKRNEDK
jgi:hypothetical protein